MEAHSLFPLLNNLDGYGTGGVLTPHKQLGIPSWMRDMEIDLNNFRAVEFTINNPVEEDQIQKWHSLQIEEESWGCSQLSVCQQKFVHLWSTVVCMNNITQQTN